MISTVGYKQALDDMENRLLDASPEACCTVCVLRYTSPSNPPDQTLKIVQDVVACTSEAFQKITSQKVRSFALESEFQLGYERALNDVAYQVSASRTSQLARNARDDNREMPNRRMIEEAIQLVVQGQVCDTFGRRWSERTQSYQVVWAAVPPKEEQH